MAQDYDGGHDIAPVLERIEREGAFVEYEARGVPHWRDADRIIPTHLIRFDASKFRNTEVHGLGYRHGFVCHIERDRED